MPDFPDTPRPRTPAPRIDPVFLWPTPNREDFVFYVERNGDLPANKTWFYGSACYDPITYPNHKLIYVTPQTPDKWSKWYYASNRVLEDAYNWEWTKCDIAGTEYSAIRRSYLIPRTDFSETEPAMASANPDVPKDKFAAGYVLAARNQQRTQDPQFDSLYVLETRVYVLRCALTSVGVDNLNGKTLFSSYYLYHISEKIGGTPVLDLVSDPTNAYWGLQTDGYVRTFMAVSCEWYKITTAQEVTGTVTAGPDGEGNTNYITVVAYDTNVNYALPAVLDTIEFLSWERRDGGDDIRPAIRFNPDSYNGPCKVAVLVTWRKTPFTLSIPDQMIPTRLNYSAPFFEINIPECLHTEWELHCDIGSTDPVYTANYNSGRIYPATNYTEWPATLVIDDDQQPYKGGFLRTKRTLTTPPVVAAGTWETAAPTAPTGLSATPMSATQIDLAWTDVASNETSYRVQRKTGGAAYATIATLAANTAIYSDTNVVTATTYTYRVRAYRGSRGSVYSSTASATTP
jgi:hypothetical protein